MNNEEDDDTNDPLEDVIPTKTKLRGKPKPTEVELVACPDCGCDYVVALHRVQAVKSFAGDRIQVCAWPSRENDDGETALVACPSCGLIYKVHADGHITKTENKWSAKKKKK